MIEFIYKAKKEGKYMAVQTSSANKAAIINEIIDNAVELPLESQNVVLLIAKSMKYTRECVMRQKEAEECCKR